MTSRPFLPIATAVLTLFALAVACAAEVSVLLQLDWAAVASGQLWRLWTGHLVHWTADHLFWDALAFFTLGAVCEREDRSGFLLTIGAGLPAISAGLAVLCPEISIYRGLSGIDTGLFVWLVLAQFHRSWWTHQRGLSFLWGSLFGGLVGKLLYEAATGSCLFVTTSPDSFRPLVESHLLGAAVGVLAFARSAALAGGSALAGRSAAGPQLERDLPQH